MMNKLEFLINNQNYTVIIDKYKILYGSNYLKKFEIYKCLKSYFSKVPFSEYSKENNNKLYIKINDTYVDSKSMLFFEIGPEYDFISDSKLGTKSILLKYLELSLEGIEYEDNFNTIKELLHSLITFELDERLSFNNDDLLFYTQCDDFNFKSLVKFILPTLSKSGMEINNIDLNYEESIVFQLKLINRISIKSKKDVFCYANISNITPLILKTLNDLNKNVNIIIDCNYIDSDIDLNNAIFIDLNWLDFLNEDSYVDYMMDSPYTYDIESLKSKIKETIYYCDLKKSLYKLK